MACAGMPSMMLSSCSYLTRTALELLWSAMREMPSRTESHEHGTL